MTDLVSKPTHPEQRRTGYLYRGETLRHVAMPLGGIGCGQIALGGDGGLRQWQMVNQINHLGFVPDSFFAIRATCGEPPINEVRILQSREVLNLPTEQTPLVNDNVIPEDQRMLLQRFPGVTRTTFTGAYPFARIGYEDEQLPVEVELEAYTPFVPLDAEKSSLPAILFSFNVRNRLPYEVHGNLGATLQNAIGWDGLTPISGNRCSLYGGNVNRVHRRSRYTSIVMENPSLSGDHPGAGQMVLSCLTPGTITYERWTTPEQFIQYMQGNLFFTQGTRFTRQPVSQNSPLVPGGSSPAGETCNGGLLTPFRLAPGETTTIIFIMSWHFPNRYLNFDQFGTRRDYGKSKFWLGNAYTTRFADALEVTEYLIDNRASLEDASRRWSEGIFQSTLDSWLAEALAAQGIFMRSPTVFQTEDGRFYGFEGSLGASTQMWNALYGGSCPLNCTHVWNYEMALSRLFPRLEQSMRETDFEHAQSAEGYIPHRTVLPLYLPQFWNEPIGGPTNPALDGMLGTILKTYREVRQGAGDAWLDRLWPRVKMLVQYIVAHWDENDDGVLEGEQPNTYDIAFYGPNMYIGALWLAALRATEELAKQQGEASFAREVRQRFERGSTRYDELLWNGEYYIQIIDDTMPQADQFGEGCLADQLFGQWWAHMLDLGYLLPEQHVKTTLRSIVQYNVRHGFRDFEHHYRVFANDEDSGLLVCTWPHGGRPEIPVRYCDEVWTGMEYQVGVHCLFEGLHDEGLSILSALRQRYDGTHRNPYNEVECGDHYARAMAGWSMLEALSGFTYHAVKGLLSFAPRERAPEFRVPFITGSGWGTFEWTEDHIRLTCAYGKIHIRQLSLPGCPANARVTLDGKHIRVETRQDDNQTFVFAEPLVLPADSCLEID
ncbi:GH116 family glycosyl-hydrolase [Ktedonospora formicarum]|uniref:Glucosylceramidase n=1 Tax=Ktedonospora formicarum TaxID=2778364 RepID=A0A8J3HR57_9CHLR|nr:GH116 family glycosyl-hydrolase [Ktedonospora formicarum]GHO42089.1 hypothetical protein KSX_02520 [Ktedonospora formicarum]